jgi:hypothetical protein
LGGFSAGPVRFATKTIGAAWAKGVMESRISADARNAIWRIMGVSCIEISRNGIRAPEAYSTSIRPVNEKRT